MHRRCSRRLYSVLICCVAAFAFARLLWRGFRDRSYWQALPERFGFGATIVSPIWLHAVSLGEMTAAAALIRGIQAQHPGIPLVITTATPAGRARAQAMSTSGINIRYLPYDTPGSMRRFFASTHPRLAVLMETELWPNLFERCRLCGVPLLIVNARLSSKSVARYRMLDRLFGGLVRNLFTDTVFVAAQSTGDVERFTAIGAAPARTCVAGNIKFDLQSDPLAQEKARALRASLGFERPVWIAGSTHAGEDEQVLAAHSAVLAQLPDAILLLAPRHKDRFIAAAQLIESRGFRFSRRSVGATSDAATQVVLVDTLGDLAMLYGAADVAFVGGSLVPIGGHNLLEPAAVGLPVLTGPSYSNGNDVARLLLQRGAAIEVADARELAGVLLRLFEDAGERQRIGALGREIIGANRGSVTRLLQLVDARLFTSSGEYP